MFDFIAREDDQRTFGGEARIEQRLGERRQGIYDFAIGKPAPIVSAVAIGDHERIGGFFRPLGNGIDNRARIGRKGLVRTDEQAAIAARLGMCGHAPHPDRTNRRSLSVHDDPPNRRYVI